MIGNKKTILITGGLGFLGSNLVKSLIDRYKIIIYEKQPFSPNRLSDIEKDIFFYYEKDNLQDIFAKHDVGCIIHTATDYGRNNQNSILAESNLLMPLKLLKCGIENGVSLFINTDTVLDPFISEYALTKSQFCQWLKFYSSSISIINMQLEHFYGEGTSSANFISFIAEKLAKNEPSIDLTKGEQLRDFIYYTDVISAFTTVLERSEEFSESFTNFQVSSGKLISIRELVETLKGLICSSSNLNFGALPYRSNELMFSRTDNSSLLKLGWKPQVDILEGLERMANFYKNK
jgi:nucleoside-diphosphate-sugar epimerase